MGYIVRLGDTIKHGAVVTESIPHTSLNGKPMAGKDSMVTGPLCKGAFPIALAGMKTASGATLIASGSHGVVHC
ncbi:PAAR domain-containing protein [Pseudomonas mucidolens]|uniref:PAAR domain-containing protein n=1 Tax=Pseudomonas mucidolens TaxID=46679 RepID=UPI0030DDA13A